VLAEQSASPKKSLQDWFDLLDSLDVPKDLFEREVHKPVEREFF
jgi:hypothetical protein